jgi:6-phosphogluconolactonase
MFVARTVGFVLVVTAMYAQQHLPAEQHKVGKYWVYVGTAAYDGPPSRKLYVCTFDSNRGELKLQGVAAETENSGFLAVHPNQRFIYATNEVGEFRGQQTGAVSSFQIDEKTGQLRLLNQVPSFGANPAYVTVNRAGTFLLLASYYGGTMSLPISPDGLLGQSAGKVRERGVGVDPRRQESSHPHSVVLSPDDRFAITPDLGLDRLFVYRFDEKTGSLTANSPAFVPAPPGSGPRHLAFSPDRHFAYVVNELKSTVSTYAFDEQAGILHPLQTISTLPPGFDGENTGAEVQVGPSGRFVYVSNRGHDSIGIFAVDPENGMLSPIQDVPTLGKTPRYFAFDPSGNFVLVANQDSDQIVLFKLDRSTGRLTPTGTALKVATPVCIVFAAR